MKLSFWDIMASMVMLAGLALATIFINIFINPYSFINPFPPPTPIATLNVPTLTPSQRALPELWTLTPGLSGTPDPNSTPTVTSTGFTSTATVTGTGAVLSTRTATATKSMTPAVLRTTTKTPNRTLTTYYNKTATKTLTKTSTSSDTTPPTNPGTPKTSSSTANPNPYWTWTASSDSGSGVDYYQVTWGPRTDCDNTLYKSYTNSWTAPTMSLGTRYYICVRARDEEGNESSWVGPSGFTYSAVGAPDVLTSPATSITSSSAILNGLINANGYDTAVYFEYGPTTSYGMAVVGSPATVTGTSDTAVTYTLSGLPANTSYHFRVYGINAIGRVNGLDSYFTTSKLASTTTIGTIAPEPSVVGQSYNIPVTVTGAGATPTGSVTIMDGSVSCTATLTAGAGSCNLISTTVGAPKTITASYGGNTTYLISSTTASHTVDKATPTVSAWPTASGITFGQALSSSTLAGGTASVAGTFTFTNPATVPPSVGSYTADVTFTPTNIANYNTVAGTVSVAVSLATPTITFDAAPTPSYLDGSFTVNAATTNTDSTDLTYSVSSGTACTYSGAGGVFNIVSAGACTVRADGAATANFNAAFATQPITIAKETATITFDPAPSPTYGDGTFSVSASTDNTDSATLTYSRISGPCTLDSGSTFNISGAGECVVRASGAATTNYNAATEDQSVTIAKASQTITFTGPGTGTVGGNASLSATASSTLTVTFSSLTTSICTVSGTTVNYVSAGTCTIAADQAGNANYEAAPQVTDDITVS